MIRVHIRRHSKLDPEGKRTFCGRRSASGAITSDHEEASCMKCQQAYDARQAFIRKISSAQRRRERRNYHD